MSDRPALEDRYLALLKDCLTGSGAARRGGTASGTGGGLLRRLSARYLAPSSRSSSAVCRWRIGARAEGRDWPAEAETMIGRARLDHLLGCVEDVVRRRSRATSSRRGCGGAGPRSSCEPCSRRWGAGGRVVWVADSFQGVPRPDPARYPKDAESGYGRWRQLAVPVEQVKANFARYGMLDDRVRFLVGCSATRSPPPLSSGCPSCGSTATCTSPRWTHSDGSTRRCRRGGYVIVDDYGAVAGCRAAVDDYRSQLGIDDPIERIDWTGVFWRRGG